MDLVSVIIPVYNNSKTLDQTLDSILKQDYRPIEIIIVDDQSSDGSYAFAKAYSQQNQQQDINFIVQQNPANMGAGFTRNEALKHATGRYIAFLDADDLWKPHKLMTQLKAMKSSDRSVCYSAYEIFDEHSSKPIAIQRVFEKLTFEKLHKTNYLGNLTGIYDVKVIGKISISNMRKRQDWSMWLDVLKKGGPAIGIQEPLASYRLGDGLSSSKLDLIKYNFTVYRDHLGYGFVKSCWCMLLFSFEQFFVKNRMRHKINN
ncbi:glycosyltransferase family 2 protein [Nonlabens agnitus]|uniref:Glycosyl transferase family 2 n=1 Tax=Nonlabens agnitus TaxID=870484 RepID=A0A2S9WWN0_9FLAO|nr:glycosyltransferase family 2 protein [Nonlabens agnitus]PRP67786.1 glycosyl transferase family 2 [Nonlabens agnitus]